jgi:hypothetical protein
VLAFAIIALAAAVPFVFVRVPAIADDVLRLEQDAAAHGASVSSLAPR